jgi:hypothetical protein
MDKATFAVALLLILFAFACLMTLPKRDLEREQWCRDNGWECGIMRIDGVYYCASRPVPIVIPEYLQ